mgnify:CR=1
MFGQEDMIKWIYMLVKCYVIGNWNMVMILSHELNINENDIEI